jgi:hypothetical protein
MQCPVGCAIVFCPAQESIYGTRCCTQQYNTLCQSLRWKYALVEFLLPCRMQYLWKPCWHILWCCLSITMSFVLMWATSLYTGYIMVVGFCECGLEAFPYLEYFWTYPWMGFPLAWQKSEVQYPQDHMNHSSSLYSLTLGQFDQPTMLKTRSKYT